MNIYKIADVVFGANVKYEYTHILMKNFQATNGESPEFVLTVTDDDLKREKLLNAQIYPDCVYESTALYRKLLFVLLEKYDAFFFHCSAIAIDGKAVIFTAKSGTGKSTHRRLWQENFGEKVTVINDDKPIVRRINGTYYVCGTPWCGKENVGCNVKVPAKALCFLSRSQENSISAVGSQSVLAQLLNQTIRPKDNKLMLKLIDLLDGFSKQMNVYNLKVNMDNEAAIIAYKKICEDIV